MTYPSEHNISIYKMYREIKTQKKKQRKRVSSAVLHNIVTARTLIQQKHKFYHLTVLVTIFGMSRIPCTMIRIDVVI